MYLMLLDGKSLSKFNHRNLSMCEFLSFCLETKKEVCGIELK